MRTTDKTGAILPKTTMEENIEDQVKEAVEETKMPIIQPNSRRFLGVFPPMSSFDKKHLKSYLKGYTRFTFGRNKYRETMTHEVKQEYYVRSNEQR